jgi:ATP-dependent exoDNAse (exonuclease V) alpha subunit
MSEEILNEINTLLNGVKLSEKQELFINEVLAGKNIFLTGKAGTGKSFVVKLIIQLLKKINKKVVAIAPTGIAANNIGGQTIHSMFSINPYGVNDYDSCNFLKTEKRRMMKNIDVIFIDEISMLRPDILDAINWTLLKNGCPGLETKQIVFIGDLKQLPPVLDDNTRSILYRDYDGDNFNYAKIYPKLNVVDVELDEVLRQSNEDFIHNLNIIREGNKSEYFKRFVGTDYKGIILAPHNTTVDKYNSDGLAAIDSELFTFTAKIEGNVKADEFNLQSTVNVKMGAKIMYLANSKENPLVNGTLGVFITHAGCHYIRVNDVDYALQIIKFTKKEYVFDDKSGQLDLKEIGSIEQYPIKLAYALSIHKSQGLTFNEVTVDLTRPCFQKGQMYVALSRVTSPEGLRIII